MGNCKIYCTNKVMKVLSRCQNTTHSNFHHVNRPVAREQGRSGSEGAKSVHDHAEVLFYSRSNYSCTERHDAYGTRCQTRAKALISYILKSSPVLRMLKLMDHHLQCMRLWTITATPRKSLSRVSEGWFSTPDVYTLQKAHDTPVSTSKHDIVHKCVAGVWWQMMWSTSQRPAVEPMRSSLKSPLSHETHGVTMGQFFSLSYLAGLFRRWCGKGEKYTHCLELLGKKCGRKM